MYKRVGAEPVLSLFGRADRGVSFLCPPPPSSKGRVTGPEQISFSALDSKQINK